MTSFSPSALGRGLSIAEWSINCINRTGTTITRGQCVLVDVTGSATEVIDADRNTGTNFDPLANVVAPTDAAGLLGWDGIGVIADADVLDNEPGQFWVRHPNILCSVDELTAAGSIMTLPTDGATAAELRMLDTLATAEAELTAGQVVKIVGFAWEADTTNLALCHFDGYQGFGKFVAIT